jgi:ribosomal protein S2
VISKTRQMKLMHFTNHNFISDKSWVSGIFRNRLSIVTYLKLIQSQNFSKSVKLLLKIKTKPHLVVLFNQKVETATINEFYKLGIPILSFNWNSLHNFKVAYRTLGNFNFIERNIKLTFFYLFYSLLKKTPLQKRKRLRQRLMKPLKTVSWNNLSTSNSNIYAFYKKTA